MSAPATSFSSPVRTSGPPPENRTANQAEKDSREQDNVSEVPGDTFLDAYLSGCSLAVPVDWPNEQRALVYEIERVRTGEEKFLYTESAPLLRLLNLISKHVFNSLGDPNAPALVFRPGNKRHLANPYVLKQRRFPDVLVVWEPVGALEQALVDSRLSLFDPPKTWSGLAAVGEVKVKDSASYQLGNYTRNLLHLHPELNAALGFAVQAKGYQFMYHDASTTHQSTCFSWIPGPMYTFISRLYDRPFRDVSMAILSETGETPAWVTKIGKDVFVSERARPEPGPGQRRFTTIAIHLVATFVLFIKVIWRDARRRYFEGLLYEQAHKDQFLSGLMSVEHHGYVLDKQGKRTGTSELGRGSEKGSRRRYKMLITTRDVGGQLEEIRSLRRFLCVMYDACVVQRNLYRKCRILHRDISDGNIMVAPDTDDYRERCAAGYADVRFVNQVLARDKNAKPNPACLIIDLGNGADLKADQGDREALTERTGTPKFIARSVACGETLDLSGHRSDYAQMPKLEGRPLELYQFTYDTQYEKYDSTIDNGLRPKTQPEVAFRHQLFHDAESTFWVIVWVLARSAGEGYQTEKEWTPEFKVFANVMKEHYPTNEKPDGRLTFPTSTAKWSKILHRDLAGLASMVSKMHEYVLPEWAYRPELDAEHVHECLMRLLLLEIIRIDESGEDIPLAVGVRSLPGQPLRTSSHHSRSATSLPVDSPQSRSQSKNRLELSRGRSIETTSPSSSGLSRKRSSSHLDREPAPRPRRRLLNAELESSSIAEADAPINQPSPLDLLITEAKEIKWEKDDCSLQHPEEGCVSCTKEG